MEVVSWLVGDKYRKRDAAQVEIVVNPLHTECVHMVRGGGGGGNNLETPFW